MMRFLFSLFLSVSALVQPASMLAQRGRDKSPAKTQQEVSAESRIKSQIQKKESEKQSLLAALELRCPGPNVMSGRVVDIDVNPSDPGQFYVAYASGGLWVTRNNGASFTPLFDQEMTMTIGDIAVDWKHDERIWIGSGEVNSSRSSYSGLGVFIGEWNGDVEDASVIWRNAGLIDSHHIGKVLIHPEKENVCWVASLGHLYSAGGERGVFKTEDGGKTWRNTLPCHSNCGAVDLVIDPMNADVLFASIWERSRTAWNFNGAGKGSAVYCSKDGGQNWVNISHGNNALAFGSVPAENVGRIGLALHHSNQANLLYVLLDNQGHRPEKKEEGDSLLWKKEKFLSISRDEFASINDSLLEKFLRHHRFDKIYTAQYVKELVAADSVKPSSLYDYLYDANEDLFSSPVIGAEVYVFDADKQSWSRCHEDYLDDLVFTYGYYFGLIRVSDSDPQHLYAGGVSLISSKDGGRNWKGINPSNVHADHHALWLNPAKPGHLINGSDGGVQISMDDGAHFVNCNTPAVGQLYAVQVDDAKPYRVYGGLQDNGVWYGASDAEMDESWKIEGHNPFTQICGGDGMQIMVDTRDNQTVYTGYQFGNYMRKNLNTGEEKWFRIRHKLGEKPLRWNWESPILLSKHNQDILYLCSNKVHRSTDQGEHFETISGDLTAGAKAGNVPFASITCIDESPLRFGLLAVGTDDGKLWISSENGYVWKEISSGLPAGKWISSIRFSSHSLNRLYVTLSGYRNDDFTPMVFVSDDNGKKWTRITSGLPQEVVNVIVEDDSLENLLYLGSDQGLYFSLDRGKSWQVLSATFPKVAVHDLVIQKREADLVVATHGRSIWIADMEEVRAVAGAGESPMDLIPVKPITRESDWGGNWSKWFEPNVPEVKIPYYTRSCEESLMMDVLYSDSLIHRQKLPVSRSGLNYWNYHLDIEQSSAELLNRLMMADPGKKDQEEIRKADNGHYYLPAGTYTLVLSGNSGRRTRTLVIE